MMHTYGFMGFGWLFQFAIVLLFFLVLWWMLRGTSRFGYRCGCDESGMDILKRRFARGEIEKREYERLKREIEKD